MAIKVHLEKLTRQQEGIEKWRNSDIYGAPYKGCGTWWWVTGMGKTYGACIIVNKLLDKNPASTIIVIVPSEALQKQWTREVINFVGKERAKNVIIYTIDKIIESSFRIECTFLILDEIHEYLTEQRIKVVNGTLITTKFKLGLTATWLDKQGRQKLIEKYVPVIDRIDEVEAEEKGFISKSIEYNIGIELTKVELDKYKEYSDIIQKLLTRFGKGMPLEMASKVLSGDKKSGTKGIIFAMAIAKANGWYQGMDLTNETNQQIFDMWSPKKIIGYAHQLMDSIRGRKDILYCAQNKLYVAKELFFKYNNLKTIFFSQSTLFADRLAYIINEHHKQQTRTEDNICVSYHSKIETQIRWDVIKNKEVKVGQTKLKREAIEGIKSGKYRGLSSTCSLDRGYDEPTIRLGITTSGTQNPTQYAQRKGRTTRVEDYEKEIIKLVINVYVKNTKDEDWLRNRQKKVKTIVYWCDNIDDVNYTPDAQDTFNLNDF
jgi:superfamily II DNA or RNA helicase